MSAAVIELGTLAVLHAQPVAHAPRDCERLKVLLSLKMLHLQLLYTTGTLQY